jgi:hypothetical protein
MNVATTAVQLVAEPRPNVPVTDPVELVLAASFAALNAPVSNWKSLLGTK